MAMNDALREQLLKAGLVDEKTARQTAREQLGERKAKRKQGKKAPVATSESKRLAEQAKAERRERERALNAERAQARTDKAAAAEIEDMLKQHARSMRDGDQVFHFTRDQVVRRVVVTPAQRADLIAGRLAVVEHRQRFHLVPAEIVPKLRQRQADLFVHLTSELPSESDQDDAYADHPIPDDLHW